MRTHSGEPASNATPPRGIVVRFSLWVLCAMGVASMALFFMACESMGGKVSTDMLRETGRLSRYENGKFHNVRATSVVLEGNLAMLKKWLFGKEQRTPPSAIPVVPLSRERLSEKAREGLRLAWLGHAGVLMEIDGVRLLIDPVLSDMASPLPVGPKRFHPPPLEPDRLPRVDAVFISHDHYDHLDMSVIKGLRDTETAFFVPLGVAAHLKKWKVSESRIRETDWWQETVFGPLNIVCTPARHFSGRRLFDRNDTLWASWTIIGPEHRVFYSGDSGPDDHFGRIGDRFGPFDLTILKVGAYDKAWPDIHTTPEEATTAHLALKGKAMLPVHWATFNLAFHAWDAPIRRAVAAAEANGISLLTPKVGEMIDADRPPAFDPWWEKIQ